MTTLTKDDKRQFIKRFLTEEQYRYVDDILAALDKDDTLFELKYFTDIVAIPLSGLTDDPLVSSIDALSDLLRKYREQGFSEVSSIEWNEIHLRGTFKENDYAFEQRIKYHVQSWINVNEKTDAEIRAEIRKHEDAIQQLRTRLSDIRD